MRGNTNNRTPTFRVRSGASKDHDDGVAGGNGKHSQHRRHIPLRGTLVDD